MTHTTPTAPATTPTATTGTAPTEAVVGVPAHDDEHQRLLDAAAAWQDDTDPVVLRAPGDGRTRCSVLRDLVHRLAGVDRDSAPGDGLPTVPVRVVTSPAHRSGRRPV
jgi:hypothetical protein